MYEESLARIAYLYLGVSFFGITTLHYTFESGFELNMRNRSIKG